MGAAHDPAAGRSPFLRTPASHSTAVCVEVPHAGLAIPDDPAVALEVTRQELLRDADLYVEKLYAQAPTQGAELLSAFYSRYVVDLNRSADDVDRSTVADHPSPRLGQTRGVIWRTTTRGRPCLGRALSYRDFSQRIQSYYTPYHLELRRLLQETRARQGFAVLVAAHSMPSRGRPSEAARADVVPGSLGGTSCAPEVLEVVDRVFGDAGLSIRHDVPYQGGHTTAHYGRPALGWHVVQVELNRALYMDEDSSKPRPGDFEALQAILTRFVGELTALRLPRADGVEE